MIPVYLSDVVFWGMEELGSDKNGLVCEREKSVVCPEIRYTLTYLDGKVSFLVLVAFLWAALVGGQVFTFDQRVSLPPFSIVHGRACTF